MKRFWKDLKSGKIKIQRNWKKLKINKNQKLLIFFGILTSILWFRLFFLEVIKHDEYNSLLFSQHYNISDLEPERWNIFMEDKNWDKIHLTQNINLYKLYADPHVVWDHNEVSKILWPVLYKHFCLRYQMDKVDKKECVENVEKFAKITLQKKNEIENTWLLTWDMKNTQLEETENLDYITTWALESAIEQRLVQMLQKTEITKAYIGFFEDEKLIEQLKQENIEWLIIQNHNYVYVDLDKIWDLDKTISKLYNTLNPVKKWITIRYLKKSLNKRPNRYVKIADYVNPLRIQEIKDLKEEFKNTKSKDKIPLFHGIWFTKQPFRFYPQWDFLSHVIWYINWENGVGWIEEFYNDELKWKKWKIIWMNTPWIWDIGSSQMKVQNATDGADVYITIDYSLQSKLEEILSKSYYTYKPDSVSAVIMDPYNWEVKALANYPNFNPNSWKDIYKIKPLTQDYNYIIWTWNIWLSYIDIPILYETWGKLALATTEQKKDPKLKKYIYKNILWPRTFLNWIIAEPFEPWSIFKILTEAIAIDSQDISLYDYYHDKWKLDVWPFTITNVEKRCEWYNTFLHALERSCNVWMAKIVMKVGKDVFYNYLQQLGFGKRTWIQLANEETWEISALKHFSLARFYNNSFWQWLLVTPMQMATSLAASINGWKLIKPTIIKKIKRWSEIEEFGTFIVDKVFSSKISKDIIYALWSVIYQWDLINLAVKDYTLWWKTWTSQIAYKWKYKWWKWRTIWSFAWITTKENLKYVIVVKMVRPRTCEWWLCTAWKIYQELAKFIIEYDWIKK